jgi:predicted RNase H-like HicB family nuclease
MQTFRMPIRAVFYREEDFWVAHCLEFDIMGHGKTQKEALEMLEGAIKAQIEATIRFNNPRNLFSPADGRIFAMYAAGRPAAEGSVVLATDQVTIENVTTREYSNQDVELVPA